MTTNKEDYLKAIYYCGGLYKRVTTTEVAKQLGIASASVTEMIARLAKEELLSYKPYKGSQLTQKGIDACINVVRSHELWEVFLVQYLGCSLSEAHKNAEELEHATSPMLADRLDHFLNMPAACPHGAMIPRPGNIPPNRNLIPLSAIPAGDRAVIGQIEESKELLDYLEPLGIVTGIQLTVQQYGAYEGPVDLLVNDKILQLSRKATEQIWVFPDAT